MLAICFKLTYTHAQMLVLVICKASLRVVSLSLCMGFPCGCVVLVVFVHAGEEYKFKREKLKHIFSYPFFQGGSQHSRMFCYTQASTYLRKTSFSFILFLNFSFSTGARRAPYASFPCQINFDTRTSLTCIDTRIQGP